MLAGGGRITPQSVRYIFFKRNTAKKLFLSFYFYNGFIFVKKYFEKIRNVFFICKKLFLKKFSLGKVFGGKFPRESCFAEKMFAESTRKKFWKKKFPQRWPKKFLSGKSLAWEKIIDKKSATFESRKLKRRNAITGGEEHETKRKTP